VIFDHIECDEYNLDQATKRLTAAEIEQAIWKRTEWTDQVTSAAKKSADRSS
jgi:hypothetical protein